MSDEATKRFIFLMPSEMWQELSVESFLTKEPVAIILRKLIRSHLSRVSDDKNHNGQDQNHSRGITA